jgi:hypothetical protein
METRSERLFENGARPIFGRKELRSLSSVSFWACCIRVLLRIRCWEARSYWEPLGILLAMSGGVGCRLGLYGNGLGE